MSNAPDSIPGWTHRGGHFRGGYEPGPWFKKRTGNQVGQWNRKELVPFGRAAPEYRAKFYVCPECGAALLPLEREYRYACSGCRLILAWSWGGLYGFGSDHEKAEFEKS